MKKLLLSTLTIMLLSAAIPSKQPPKTVTLSKTTLQDKIKGGWAAQVIGCTFGGPTEFRFTGTMINDYQPETAKLPVNFTHRRYDLFWKYQLPKGKHTVRIKLLNPDNDHVVRMSELLVYSDQPVKSKL